MPISSTYLLDNGKHNIDMTEICKEEKERRGNISYNLIIVCGFALKQIYQKLYYYSTLLKLFSR